MKKSEIKDLFNQSIAATNLLKVNVVLLPYARGNTAIHTAIEMSARLDSIVKAICDYMIDDGSVDMTERLQEIKAEARKIESDVAKMGYSKERVTLCLNCRSIINNIKDAEEWAKPQQEAPEAPQQQNECLCGELAGNNNKTTSKPKRTPKTITDRITNNVDASDLLKKLHTLMDNKSGKDALVYLTICIADGKLNRPTFKQFQNEFTNICERANYYRYTKKAIYTADELSAARIAFHNCK